MRVGRALGIGLLLAAACGAPPPGVEAVRCAAPLPYAGPALYSGPIPLPAAPVGAEARLGEELERRLDAALLDALGRTHAHVMTAAVATAQGRWSATRAADGSPQPLRLYWASVGKALTATVILQLAEEGRLSLADPLSRWFPELPNAAAIRVDDLLQHTSGLFSANEDLRVRAQPRYYAPAESIAIAAEHGALFCPGQRWRYSNTGYTILGQIIERIEGRPYHEVVNARIGARLQMGLRALAPQEDAADVAPLSPAEGAPLRLAPSWGEAAGSAVGSAEEMLRFWQALLTAQLLSPQHTAQLFERLYPMFDPGTYYGRGVMLYVLPGADPERRIWLGHGGGTPGAKAVVAYSPADEAYVAVALSGDGSAEASANLLLRQLHARD